VITFSDAKCFSASLVESVHPLDFTLNNSLFPFFLLVVLFLFFLLIGILLFFVRFAFFFS